MLVEFGARAGRGAVWSTFVAISLLACAPTIIEESAGAGGGSAGSGSHGEAASSGAGQLSGAPGASSGARGVDSSAGEGGAGADGVAGEAGGATLGNGGSAVAAGGSAAGGAGSGAGGSGAPCAHATGWLKRTPSALSQSWPPARQGAAFAFDPALGKTVLYGGYSIDSFVDVHDTWAWDGSAGSWSQLQVNPPNAGDHPAAAYDSARQRLLLFGGEGSGQSLWEWNGAASVWTDRTPSPLPTLWPQGSSWVAAYDPARQRFVLQDTYEAGGTPHQTWELDSSTGVWVNRSSVSAPGGIVASFVWDPVRQRGVLFGGLSPVEVWEWNGESGHWLARLPASGAPWPAARSGMAVAFDSSRGRPLLFGGVAVSPPFNPENGAPPPPKLFNDLWEWDGDLGTWLELDDGTCPAVPSGRYYQAMSFDPLRSRAVLYQAGDNSNAPHSEVWEWMPPSK